MELKKALASSFLRIFSATTPFANNVTEVIGGAPATIQTGLPALSSGWTYRTFRDAGTASTVPKTFLRAKISETP